MHKGQQSMNCFTETQELFRQKRVVLPFMIASSCQILRYTTKGTEIVLDNNVSNYHALLNNVDIPGIKIVLLRYINAIQVVKSINPDYLNLLFVEKDCPYYVQDNSILSRPLVKSTQHGIKSLGVMVLKCRMLSYWTEISIFITRIQTLDQKLEKPNLQMYRTWHVYLIQL